jgi:hypothetical protein
MGTQKLAMAREELLRESLTVSPTIFVKPFGLVFALPG